MYMDALDSYRADSKQPVMDKHYFIKKFEAIPGDQWCRISLEDINGRRCAIGHTMTKQQLAQSGNPGFYPGTETRALGKLFGHEGRVMAINDHSLYHQQTPKEAILQALRELPEPVTMQMRVGIESVTVMEPIYPDYKTAWKDSPCLAPFTKKTYLAYIEQVFAPKSKQTVCSLD